MYIIIQYVTHIICPHCSVFQGIKDFSAVLQRVTLDLPYMGGFIPEAWLQFEEAIVR
jgi:hypothetical protein